MSNCSMFAHCPFCDTAGAIVGHSTGYGTYVECKNPACKTNGEAGDAFLKKEENVRVINNVLFPFHGAEPCPSCGKMLNDSDEDINGYHYGPGSSCARPLIKWGPKETVTDINCEGEQVTFTYRDCRLCFEKFSEKAMEQHAKDHETGVVKDLDSLPSSFL
jgi:hypothetical protein